jgi:CRISPR-associated protein Csd1
MALSSANNPSFESWGLKQNQNSPTCRKCGEAYAKAINYMIKNPEHHIFIGDTVLIFWTNDENEEFSPFTYLNRPDNEQVHMLFESFKNGILTDIKNSEQFFAILFSTAASRLVMRSMINKTISQMYEKLVKWFSMQKIGSDPLFFGIWALCSCMFHDPKKIPPSIPGWMFRCAFEGYPLPLDFLMRITTRNRTERNVTRVRAILTRMILITNQIQEKEKEDYMQKLDTDEQSPGYNCGRLLALLEIAQKLAVPNINSTLVDKSFGSASSNPSLTFGSLLRNFQNHISKIRRTQPAAAFAIENRLTQITKNIGNFPPVLNLREQGLFGLGFYHQKNAEIEMAIERKRQKQIMDSHESKNKEI